MDKEINNNGHKYVDLDLPSGTLWSTMNVGASKPSDSGLYFQWGDTKGYTKDEVGIEKQFNWANYKFCINKIIKNFSKYTTLGSKLELVDDAANVNMGGDWHIPTPGQILELINNTTNEWETLDDVGGMTFTSKMDSSKSIFIPAAGNAWGGSVNGNGSYGNVWSSMLDTSCIGYGQSLHFRPSGASLYGNDGYFYDGFSIRGVIG